jgi:cell wall-associated NlpC family hydrolase
MSLTTSPLSFLRRCACSGVIALTMVGGVTAVSAFDSALVAAADSGLPVNALAPEITASAEAAVAALDANVESGSVADERTLAFFRGTAARYAARELGYDELAMVDAWSTTTLAHQRAVLAALTQVGVPYRTNTSIEGEGFDCSGLTTYAWQGSGYDLFRQSGSQISQAKAVSRDEAKAGDLVHYPGHVMMYLGVGDAIVHSIQTGRTVEGDEFRRGSVSFGDPTLSD